MQKFNQKVVCRQSLSMVRQSGISLIPALITIGVFTLLTTQVIMPNQIRKANETLVSSLVNSAEKLEQASLAYHAKNGDWPTSIDGDLVPNYLPAFNSITDTGFSWTLVKVYTMASGTRIYDPIATRGWPPPNHPPPPATPTEWWPGGGSWSVSLLLESGDRKLAEAVINKIGGHAILSDTLPNGNVINGPENYDVIDIPIVKTGSIILNNLTIDNLTINDQLNLGTSSSSTAIFKLNGLDVTLGIKQAQLNVTPTPSTSRPGWPNFSSKRSKQNIQSLDTPLESIYQLKPVSFDYKDAFKQYKTNNAANREIGLIAEQVLPLVPEITLINKDKVIGVDYQKLNVILLKAVQGLKTDIEVLRQSNQQLHQQMDNLSRTGTVDDHRAMSSVK